ncbi:hypothetical protein [Cognataquiflexum nitidum]|nr:hypothetical protein [Cognataquiflexum nitidum]
MIYLYGIKSQLTQIVLTGAEKDGLGLGKFCFNGKAEDENLIFL